MLQTRRSLSNEDWCVRYGYVRNNAYQPVVNQEQILSVVDAMIGDWNRASFVSGSPD